MLKFKSLVEAALLIAKPFGYGKTQEDSVESDSGPLLGAVSDLKKMRAATPGDLFEFANWEKIPQDKIPPFLAKSYQEAMDLAKTAASAGAKTVGFDLKTVAKGVHPDGGVRTSKNEVLLSFNADGAYTGKVDLAPNKALRDICLAQIFFDCSDPSMPQPLTPNMYVFESNMLGAAQRQAKLLAQSQQSDISKKLAQRLASAKIDTPTDSPAPSTPKPVKP